MTHKSSTLPLLAVSLSLVGTTASAHVPAPSQPNLYPASRRWIAVTTDFDCPVAQTENAGKGKPVTPWHKPGYAFTTDKSEEATGLRLPSALLRFCVYTRDEPSASPPSFSSEDQKKIAKIEADYDVLLPQSAPGVQPGPIDPSDLPGSIDRSDLPDPRSDPDYKSRDDAERAIREAGASLFAEMVGVTSSGKTQSAYTKGRDQAYLAIVDTADGGGSYEAAGFQRHGLAMAAIAAAVRCPSGEKKCSDRTLFAQAFPYTKSRRAVVPSSPQLGGTVSLAQAIWTALRNWRKARHAVDSTGKPVAANAPLVLNLSLGWDPARYGTIPEDMSPEHLLLLDDKLGAKYRQQVPVRVQMVHAALVYASCLDVLTIASAGNWQVDGCDAQGPLAPAQWERLKAPTRAQCESLFLADWLEPPRPGMPGKSSGSNSLVYAVGGMSWGRGSVGDIGITQTVLPTARPGGVPPRLMLASHAIARWRGEWTESWSGTSVAAAAYSGLAAALWTQRADLTPHQLVAWIDASGDEYGKADFPTPGQTARIVSGYHAYEKVCPQTARASGKCDLNPYSGPTGNRKWDLLAAYGDTFRFLKFWGSRKAELGGSGKVTPQQVDLGCGRQLTHFSLGDSGPQALPSNKYQLAWVRPQPETPICPVCPVKGGKLILSLNPNARGTHWPAKGEIVLKNPTLQFSRQSVNLGDLRISGDVLEVDLNAIKVNNMSLFDALNLKYALEGTLTITVDGADGQPATMTSVVQVLE